VLGVDPFGGQSRNPDRYMALDKPGINSKFQDYIFKNACRKGEGRCLCSALMPLLRSFQVFGIFPVRHEREICTVTHSWTSPYALINLLWILGNLAVPIFIFNSSVATAFISAFRGTDYYTVVLVSITQFTATVGIFLAGNFSGSEFCEGKLTYKGIKL
jgi:hypothetical protein